MASTCVITFERHVGGMPQLSEVAEDIQRLNSFKHCDAELAAVDGNPITFELTVKNGDAQIVAVVVAEWLHAKLKLVHKATLAKKVAVSA
jgi:hypothetical protein